ncbi:4-diphosphocytidyl-2-C-methyl-D-erythritol kinase [mine drainage metagenome]|uniref:4-diphosphocytidyl-2-C-methyl-D-erythritol kinase n=1 Tax=mine drainage metagenome TaxID=410659 RepID=A0A1J5RQ77_9ZZZZ
MDRPALHAVKRGRGIAALYNVPAPAKINWFLHVLGRRADGYHDLQTVFQFIDWCDWLDFERRDDGMILRVGDDGLPADDLSVRAARLLQQHAGCGDGVQIRLRKAIPAQAGLGGGSSDAASTLLALNLLWGLHLPRVELQVLAARLGADVPVFVLGRNAWAEGIGDRLTAIDLPAWSLLVAWPGKGLSTAEMFGSPFLTRSARIETISGFARFADEGAPDAGRMQDLGVKAEDIGLGRNDLLPAARAALPEIDQVGAWLLERTGRGFVTMSGSGSAMFSPCESGLRFTGVSPQSWMVRKCVALGSHPLLGWAV